MRKPTCDLSSQKFGKGTVIQQVPKPDHIKKNGHYWLVQCDCGEKRIVDNNSLITKKWTNCGCSIEQNLIGLRYYSGIVVSLSHRYGGYRYWLVQCDCGKTYKARTESLTSGNTKSCGCRNKRIGKNHPHYKGWEDLSGDYWAKLQKGARIRNILFELDIKETWDLFIKQNKQCALTGWRITLISSARDEKQTASLDRIESDKGYCLGNVQWVHKDINKIKQNYEEAYFLKMCEAVIMNKRRLQSD